MSEDFIDIDIPTSSSKIKEGIFFDMSNEEYHSLDGLSSTQFQDLDLSVAIYVVEINNSDKRTLQQNRAIHKWCEQIASKLNKDEFELLIDTIIQALATKGIECPDFPNREDLESITYIKKEKE